MSYCNLELTSTSTKPVPEFVAPNKSYTELVLPLISTVLAAFADPAVVADVAVVAFPDNAPENVVADNVLVFAL